jgi:putative hydrolase of the HAD superfamily
MNRTTPITTLFLDIGGVLLSDGWDHHARRRAAKRFRLEWAEMEERHQLNFAIYEEGELSLADYMNRIVFYRKRSFTPTQFRRFMFAQSKPFPKMIELAARLKSRYGLTIAVVSNEARELNAYRVQRFKLNTFVDFYISSCFVHLHKPDVQMYRLALDVALTPARQILYIDNTPMFVHVAQGLGIRSVLHTDYKSTRAKLAAFGLKDD